MGKSSLSEAKRKKLGVALKIQRRKRGLTQLELAMLIKYSASSIQKYENGSRQPSYKTLYKIASVVGCEARDLLKSIE